MAPARFTLIASLGFILGIFFTSGPFLFSLRMIAIGVSIICISSMVVLWPYARFAVLAAIALFIGAGYYRFFIHTVAIDRIMPIGTNAVVHAIVSDEPKLRDAARIFTANLVSPGRGRVVVIADRMVRVSYGDHVRLSGHIQLPDESGATPRMFYPDVERTGPQAGSWIRTRLIAFKTTLIGTLDRHLQPSHAALLAGLTLGNTDGFTPEFRERMRASGTTHLVALSGYNIAILVSLILFILLAFLRRQVALISTLVAIAAFVLMVGAEASIVRAGTMGALAVLADTFGRTYRFAHATALAAAGMLVFDPRYLADDIGFQLSFASLLGIAYLEPALRRRPNHSSNRYAAEPVPELFDWRRQLRTTTAAQLAVLPLLLIHFGTVTFSALIANTLILGVVPYTMFVGFLLMIYALLFPPIAVLFSIVLQLPLIYMHTVIAIAAAIPIPFSTSNHLLFTIIFYALIALFIRQRTRMIQP